MGEIIGQKSELPAVCGCCLRGSGNVCAIEAPGVGSVLWLCEGCKVNMGHKVLAMNTMKLDALESAAIKAAARLSAEHMLGTMCKLAFENGITSLDKMTEEQFIFLTNLMKNDKTYQGAAALMLVTYSNEARRLIAAA